MAGCNGRCPGCGETGKVRDVRAHTVRCAQFAALYRENPAAALDPADEYARWARDEQGEAKTAARDAQVADTDARRAAMAERFRTRDPLEG